MNPLQCAFATLAGSSSSRSISDYSMSDRNDPLHSQSQHNLQWTLHFLWPNIIIIQILQFSHPYTSLYPSVSWLQNCQYYCHIYRSLQTWLLQLHAYCSLLGCVTSNTSIEESSKMYFRSLRNVNCHKFRLYKASTSEGTHHSMSPVPKWRSCERTHHSMFPVQNGGHVRGHTIVCPLV